MGRCQVCDRLVYLRGVEQRWGSKVVDYAPVQHARVVHGSCDRHLEAPEVGARWHCDKCRRDVDEDEIVVEPCDGHKRVIR